MVSDENKKYINNLKKKVSLNEIHNSIDQLSNINLLILGEPIIDTYIYCNPIGISSKNPSIAVKKTSKIDFIGGSLAIANNLNKLGCNVKLITINNKENTIKEQKNKLLKSINHSEIYDGNIVTPRKQDIFQMLLIKKLN